MAKSGVNSKALQYFIGDSNISATIKVNTYIEVDEVEEEFRKAQMEIKKTIQK